MQDGWSAGALHLQTINGFFQFSINGLTPTSNDYRFRWQPAEAQWYFIQVSYQSGTKTGGQELCAGE